MIDGDQHFEAEFIIIENVIFFIVFINDNKIMKIKSICSIFHLSWYEWFWFIWLVMIVGDARMF